MVQSTSGRSIAVIGATGAQGSSVVKALIASDRDYNIHAVTRDPTKDTSKALEEQGVTVVAADIDSAEDLARVFKCMEIIFADTNFWAHGDKAKEIADGKRITDAARATGDCKLFVWSGLPEVTKASNGRYDHMGLFESKAEVAQYAKSQLNTIDVQAGFYATNFITTMVPRKGEDGVYAFSLPFSPDTILPIMSPDDYGLYVREAIESDHFGPGSELLACSEELTITEIVKQFSEVTGKQAEFQKLPDEVFLSSAGPVGQEFLQMLKWFQDFGYFGGKDVKPSQQYLAAPLTPWKDFVKSVDWSFLQ